MPRNLPSPANARFGKLWGLSALGVLILALGAVSLYVILRSHHHLHSSNPTSPVQGADQITVLPAFTSDYREYVLSGLIERSPSSAQLFVTSFLLCHNAATPMRGSKRTIEGIHASHVSSWQKAALHMEKTRYSKPMGVRIPEAEYWCRIHTLARADGTLTSDSVVYNIHGHLLPSAMTNDLNANHRLEILRCALPPEVVYLPNVHGGMYIKVDLVRGSSVQSVLSYVIPWKTRIASHVNLNPLVNDYFPASSSLSLTPSQSALVKLLHTSRGIDPWQPKVAKRVFMCATVWHRSIDKVSLSHVLEFLEYHIAIGVDHIYLGVVFPLQSEEMRNTLRILAPYLQAGQVTVFSHADSRDRVFQKDALFSIGAGTVVFYDTSKILAVNMCLYYARGLADYLAIWDTDEFFVPNNSKQRLGELLSSVEKSHQGKCYVEVSSSTFFNADATHLPTFREKRPVPMNYTHMKLWIDQHYRKFTIRNDYLSHKKPILYVDRMMFGALHNGGGCIRSGDASNTSAVILATSKRINDNREVLRLDRNIGQVYHFQFTRTIHYEHVGAKIKPPNNTCIVKSWWHSLPGADCANTNSYVQNHRDHVLTALYDKGYYSALMLEHIELDRKMNYTWEQSSPVKRLILSSSSVNNMCMSKKLRNLPLSVGILHNTTLLTSMLVRLPELASTASSSVSGSPAEPDMTPAFALVTMLVSNQSLGHYKVYCQLQAGRLSFALPASYYATKSYAKHPLVSGYVQCNLTRQILVDTINSSLTVQLTWHSHITYETAGVVPARSCVLVFRISDMLLGTGLGFPAEDVVRRGFHNHFDSLVWKEIHSQAIFQRSLLLLPPARVSGRESSSNSSAGSALFVCVQDRGWGAGRSALSALLSFAAHHLSLPLPRGLRVHLLVPLRRAQGAWAWAWLRRLARAGGLSALPWREDSQGEEAATSLPERVLGEHLQAVCRMHVANSGFVGGDASAWLGSWGMDQLLIPSEHNVFDLYSMKPGQQHLISAELFPTYPLVHNHVHGKGLNDLVWMEDVFHAYRNVSTALSSSSIWQGFYAPRGKLVRLFWNSDNDNNVLNFSLSNHTALLSSWTLGTFFHAPLSPPPRTPPVNYMLNCSAILLTPLISTEALPYYAPAQWQYSYCLLVLASFFPPNGVLSAATVGLKPEATNPSAMPRFLRRFDPHYHHIGVVLTAIQNTKGYSLRNSSNSTLLSVYLKYHYPRSLLSLMHMGLDLFIDSIAVRKADPLLYLEYYQPYREVFKEFEEVYAKEYGKDETAVEKYTANTSVSTDANEELEANDEPSIQLHLRSGAPQ